MSEMRALVFRGPGHMEVESRPRPQPGQGEAVVEIAAAGICGSELGSFTGDSTRRPPGRVFGHELSGTVRAVGPGVSGDLEGRLVAVNPLVACGRCPTCQAGRSNVCPNRTLLGLHLDGGFAEEVAIAAANLSALDALDPLGGTLVEPYANAVHVVELLPSAVGRHVAVYGAGPIGLSVVALLRVAGAGRVTSIDPVAARRTMALQAGAHAALDPGAAGSASLAADHVVDAAGTTGSRSAAVATCQPGGAVVLLGLHSAASELPINEAIAKELRLQCSYAYAPRDFDVALALLENDAVPYRSWITERDLADGEDAFRALVEHPDEVTKIVLRPAASRA